MLSLWDYWSIKNVHIGKEYVPMQFPLCCNKGFSSCQPFMPLYVSIEPFALLKAFPLPTCLNNGLVVGLTINCMLLKLFFVFANMGIVETFALFCTSSTTYTKVGHPCAQIPTFQSPIFPSLPLLSLCSCSLY